MTTLLRPMSLPAILSLLLLALALPACGEEQAPTPEPAPPATEDDHDHEHDDDADANGAAQAPEHAEPGLPAPAFTLTGSDGEDYSLSDFQGQWVILEWINHDCPYVIKFYRPGKMQELQRTYAEQGVAWLSIASSGPGKQGHESPERWNELTAEKDAAPTAVLIDEDGTVGRRYRATNTPHMYIINPEGELVYMGAIDSDSAASSDAIEGADNYVQMVMDAVLEGSEAPIQYTDAYGCAVHYASN